jgi:hypothetical protein
MMSSSIQYQNRHASLPAVGRRTGRVSDGTKSACLVLVLSVFLFSCNTEKVQPEPEPVIEIENQASAKPADDNKATGVYKGTFVGSTGTFKLIVQLDMIVGYLTVDGMNYVLRTTDISAADLNGAITNALFTDHFNYAKLRFSVEADGNNPTATLELEGHTNVQVVVIKEFSTSQVRVYEGYRYKSMPALGIVEKGLFNITLDADSILGAAFKTVEFISLNNGNSGEVELQAWINVGRWYYYNPENENEIAMDAFGHNLLHGSVFTITDAEIHASFPFTFQENNYADSVRLKRKL